MIYIKNVKNIEDLRKQYRKLAMKMHPDKGGSQEDFIRLQIEYEDFYKWFEEQEKRNVHYKETLKSLTVSEELFKNVLESGFPQDFLKKKAEKCRYEYEKTIYDNVCLMLNDYLEILRKL